MTKTKCITDIRYEVKNSSREIILNDQLEFNNYNFLHLHLFNNPSIISNSIIQSYCILDLL